MVIRELQADQTNRKLIEMKDRVRTAKRIIKREYDKSQWYQFGIADKK